MPDWLVPVLVSPFVGSFLGVLILRLPEKRAVVWGRSHCDACGKILRPAELVPVFSYLASRGRCRGCGAGIALFHPAVELAAFGVAVWAASLDDGPRLWADCLMGWTLLALAWIDAREMILPDILTLPLILAGLAYAVAFDRPHVFDHAVGAAVGWAIFWALGRLYRALRGRDGLGQGDAKLLAASGAWVTWTGLGAVMLVGALLGLALAVIGRLRGGSLTAATAIPFGLPLAFATWLVWLYGAELP